MPPVLCPLDHATDEERRILRIWVEKGGSIRATAEAAKRHRATVRRTVRRFEAALIAILVPPKAPPRGH